MPCCYWSLFIFFNQRCIEALVKSKRQSLDAIKRRMQAASKHSKDLSDSDAKSPALFKVSPTLFLFSVQCFPLHLNYHPGILIRSASLPFPAAMTLLSIWRVCILFFHLLFLCFSVCCLPPFLLILLPPTLLSSSRLSFSLLFFFAEQFFLSAFCLAFVSSFSSFLLFFFLIISLAHSTYLFRLIFLFSYHFYSFSNFLLSLIQPSSLKWVCLLFNACNFFLLGWHCVGDPFNCNETQLGWHSAGFKQNCTDYAENNSGNIAKRRRQLYIKPSQDTDLNVCLTVVVNESDICNFHLRFHFLWIVIALYV